MIPGWFVILSTRSSHNEIRHIGEIGGERREQRGLRWAGFNLKIILQGKAICRCSRWEFPR